MMSSLVKTIPLKILAVISLLLFASAPSWGADFDKGLTAAQNGDYATALNEWRPLAEQGDASAQYNLGAMYREGKGVLRDHKAAVKWFTLAAEQGIASAQFNLGNSYYDGHGVAQDHAIAHAWYNIAAINGNESAVKSRDKIVKYIDAEQLAEAQAIVRKCIKNNYKDCAP